MHPNSRWPVQSRQERNSVPVEHRAEVGAPAAQAVRELRVASEIAQAFLSAKRPIEVYRLALERVAPLVDASLGCIFLRDEQSNLLRIVAAYNWPQRYATYLDRMRVRAGNGPTGRAVVQNKLVEVEDVFADPELEDWWDPARELGFVSSVSIPLAFSPRPELPELRRPGNGSPDEVEDRAQTATGRTKDAEHETGWPAHGPVGALTFYFRQKQAFAGADRHLLRLVASQIAATAEKAHLIDDLQRANQRLRQQNVDLEARYNQAAEAKRVKHELLANVSHELRTPLTAILGYSCLLREGVTGELSPDQQAAVIRIEHAGGQLVEMIDSLLDLANLKLNRFTPEPELCDAVALALAAIENAPTPPPRVKLSMDPPSERVPIHTDPVLVLRVLQSLLSNALKFTSEGTVTLRIRVIEPEPAEQAAFYPRGPDIVWDVSDTGIGIDSADHEVIFHEFRQADGSATRRFGGAGLGLAIAREAAQRLGGNILVQSEPGAGSTFSFSLPSSVVRAGGRAMEQEEGTGTRR
jgi:signal transduction histidine kinase